MRTKHYQITSETILPITMRATSHANIIQTGLVLFIVIVVLHWTLYLCDLKYKFLCKGKGWDVSDTSGSGGYLCAVLH